jgi:hypothetical protein
LETIYVFLEEKNYENVVATCPFCKNKNKYNRATELNNLSIIMDEEVKCQNEICQKPFRIIGDIVNPSFDLLIFDCFELIKEKRYSYCILNLAQSFEMFFALYLRVEFLYKPYAQQGNNDPFLLKTATDHLVKKTKALTFHGMQALFLNHIILTKVLMKRNAASLSESEIILAQLTTNIPDEKTLSQVEDPKLMQLLIKLRNTNIGQIRNNVVHKNGYRPSLAIVESAISETEDILNGLRSSLGPLTDNQFRYKKVVENQIV